MRKHFGVAVLAGMIGLFAAPAQAERSNDESVAAAPVAVQRVSVPRTGIPDGAAMVLVGTALIGLAAAVRRAA